MKKNNLDDFFIVSFCVSGFGHAHPVIDPHGIAFDVPSVQGLAGSELIVVEPVSSSNTCPEKRSLSSKAWLTTFDLALRSQRLLCLPGSTRFDLRTGPTFTRDAQAVGQDGVGEGWLRPNLVDEGQQPQGSQ